MSFVEHEVFVGPRRSCSQSVLELPGAVRSELANEFGRPLGEDKVTENFHRALERAGLPRIGFIDLRHTTATVMMGAGIHPKMVQETLGHGNVEIMLDIYSHVTPDMQQEAVDKLNQRYGA